MGFGAHAAIHANRLFDASANLPIVIEFVDTRENLAPLRPIIDELVREGLVTEEAVRLARYLPGPR
jgi:PII-like signaling protein